VNDPAEAFAYFRQHGVPRVVCEEKHMGTLAVGWRSMAQAQAQATVSVTSQLQEAMADGVRG